MEHDLILVPSCEVCGEDCIDSHALVFKDGSSLEGMWVCGYCLAMAVREEHHAQQASFRAN